MAACWNQTYPKKPSTGTIGFLFSQLLGNSVDCLHQQVSVYEMLSYRVYARMESTPKI